MSLERIVDRRHGIGRELGENRYLEGYRRRFTHLMPVSHPGPLVLLDGEAGADDLELAARIAARFSKGRDAAEVIIEVTGMDGAVRQFTVPPLPAEQLPPEWYL